MSTRASRIPAAFEVTTKALKATLEPVHLTFPYPTTLNHRLMPVGGRNVLSPEYRAWFKEAMQRVQAQRPRAVKGRVGIHVRLVPPDKRVRDLDNVSTKSIIDVLVKMGVIEGDDSRYVRSLHAEWVEQGHPCEVVVKPAVF